MGREDYFCTGIPMCSMVEMFNLPVFCGRNRRVCIGLASQGAFFKAHLFVPNSVGIVIPLFRSVMTLCDRGVEEVGWTSKVQNALGICNTLLMLRCQISWPPATVSNPTRNIWPTTPERKKCNDLEGILG